MGNQMIMRKKEYEYDGPGHINLGLMAELKAHLKDQGFRQQEIADLVGVAKNTISMQLAGTRTMSVAVYMKIAEYTGFTPTMFRQTQTGDEIRMDLVQNRELFAEILRKLYNDFCELIFSCAKVILCVDKFSCCELYISHHGYFAT